ncbi:MAG: hypothetical protein QOF68_2584, partial [Gaiellales bacterium]|nr:hypothetical protein [Gaiellales bacterium]
MGLLTTVSASSVLAAGINVTSSADTTADDGVCTLREAITAANTDTASGALTGECAGGSGADTITFSFAGTITLSGLLPAITTDLSISGAGAIIVSGDNAFRVFNVTAGFVALSGLTITAGSVSGGGGGIFNTANLDITDSTISGNTAAGGGGGVWSSGWLGVGDSTISGNSSPGNGGGGIWSVGTLFVMNSTISGNSGALGGGLYNLGNLLMANSTISANSATLSDGGLTAGGSETVVNSIVAGNTAPNSPEFGGDIDGGAVDSVIGVPAGMTLADILVPAGLADN